MTHPGTAFTCRKAAKFLHSFLPAFLAASGFFEQATHRLLSRAPPPACVSLHNHKLLDHPVQHSGVLIRLSARTSIHLQRHAVHSHALTPTLPPVRLTHYLSPHGAALLCAALCSPAKAANIFHSFLPAFLAASGFF